MSHLVAGRATRCLRPYIGILRVEAPRLGKSLIGSLRLSSSLSEDMQAATEAGVPSKAIRLFQRSQRRWMRRRTFDDSLRRAVPFWGSKFRHHPKMQASDLEEFLKASASLEIFESQGGIDAGDTDNLFSESQTSRRAPDSPRSKEPLKVLVLDSNWSQMWRFLRGTVAVVVVVAAVSLFAESLTSGQTGGAFPSMKKIQPVRDTKTTFADFKGADEVKEELQEIIAYLKDPSSFTRLGAKLPKGILLCGPSGTGKTMLARAMAGEAQVPFFQASASEFEEMLVGVGARRIRDLFSAARHAAPCIVFIDEIDAVGGKRSQRDTNSVRMTLNQLLVELDGFQQNEGVVVICATNFEHSLDSALTRPGRLDKTVHVPLPDLSGRNEILDVYGSKVRLDPDVDLDVIARRTAGMTGADLSNIINVGAMKASSEGKSTVTMSALEHAFDRIVVGLERRNPMSDQEKKITAVHEAGHALVAVLTPNADPIHKVTIMPRGRALGVTWQVPERERYQLSFSDLRARLDVLMAGRAAEEIVFGEDNITAGCSNDVDNATEVAKQMVYQFSMGLPPVKVPMFIATRYGSPAISEKAKHERERAVQSLLDNAYRRATALLQDNVEQLECISAGLLEYETLTAKEVDLARASSGTEDSVSCLRRWRQTGPKKR